MRTNSGYFIIASKVVEKDVEVVFGWNLETGQYVTWKCFSGKDYRWGHYFWEDEFTKAAVDFAERCEGAE